MLGNKDLLDYSMTKGVIHAFARSLATHLVDRGVRVNAVTPGPVWTPLNPADKSAEKTERNTATTGTSQSLAICQPCQMANSNNRVPVSNRYGTADVKR